MKQIENSGYFIKENGQVISPLGFALSSAINGGGYPYVTLHYNKRKFNKMIHRLLAIAYLPNPENKPQVNHIDGNKLNYSLDNLEWVTQFENMQHSVVTGLSPKGERSYLAKLTEEDVKDISVLHSQGVSCEELSKQFGITPGGISGILSGRTWKHVSREIFQIKFKAKLTPTDIPKIREMFVKGLSNTEIAEKFGVARGTIQQVRSGKNWSNY